jgi:hypothetical protein
MKTIFGHSYDKELPRELDVDRLADGNVSLCMHPPGKKGPEKIVVASDEVLSAIQAGNGRVRGHSPRGESKTLEVRHHSNGLCLITGRWWGVFRAEDIKQSLKT